MGGSETDCPAELETFAGVWSHLEVRDGMLVWVSLGEENVGGRTQVVIPKAMVPYVLTQLHNEVTGGHLGVRK